MKLVGKFRCLNEYGALETVKPGDMEKSSARAMAEASGKGVVLIVYLLAILFMFTGEN